ncbi:MAG: nucleoside-diphosphate kinase [Treponema sp.]|jgi:nucleoside diphosphate kinase|nr:nucleoside-diphosphate kinase [Treponema sp.]
MEQTISYVMVTPYTVAKSRTGGVISRLLSRLDLELVGAQMIAPDEAFVKGYADLLRSQIGTSSNPAVTLIGDYVEQNFMPSEGRRHRCLLLLFRGEDPCRKLSDICGALYAENRSIESITGETIRDTYADLIYARSDPSKVKYFEPAVLTPRTQDAADANLAHFAKYLPSYENITENMTYPDPSKIEKTLVILKPDNWKFASSRPGAIIDMFSRTGLRIVGIKVHRFSLAQALEFYGPVEGALKSKLAPIFGEKAKEILEEGLKITLSEETTKALSESVGVAYALDQFHQIIEFMSGKKPNDVPVEEINQPGSAKCMILIYEGENAVDKIRDVLGPTDPLKASGGTVRREFGSNVMVNTAHASDCKESFERERKIVEIDNNNLSEIIKTYLSLIK